MRLCRAETGRRRRQSGVTDRTTESGGWRRRRHGGPGGGVDSDGAEPRGGRRRLVWGRRCELRLRRPIGEEVAERVRVG